MQSMLFPFIVSMFDTDRILSGRSFCFDDPDRWPDHIQSGMITVLFKISVDPDTQAVLLQAVGQAVADLEQAIPVYGAIRLDRIIPQVQYYAVYVRCFASARIAGAVFLFITGKTE